MKPQLPNGYGLELVTEVSCVPFLVPLKTHRVEGLMHINYVEDQSPPNGVVWKLGEWKLQLRFHSRYLIQVKKLASAKEGTRNNSLEKLTDAICCDESQFCISGNQSSAYVRRRTHEEFSPQCLKPTAKYPTKMMVWGCLSSHGVGRLHIVSGTGKALDYIEIPQNKLLPTARDLFGNQS
ncbi:hypothetical protein TNCV_3503511 [Trichonephila clavipes]|uniref:Uncharacterized protein n=1 Tax=Trichonephila clavipes TaxID=2585209 RepID=A0A8X6S109_TRICX|nr:hypothetical protein TNCV_3503511 [Trichonephila clavipes]